MDDNQPTGETMSEGSSETPADNKAGVKLSEEFQQSAHELISDATQDELDYIQDCCAKRQDEMQGGADDTNGKPAEYSSEDMPQD